jgi:DNA polymerase-3 subunit epsilon
LANLAQHLGFQFVHHNALEDAKATVRIMEACLAKSETGIEEWLTRQFKRTDRAGTSGPGFQGAEGNPEGRLYGEQAVFTGSLSMTRNEAAAIAAQEGITVQKGVNKDTTMLVVGIQDPERLKQGESKSSKHLKAEAKIAKDQDIRILTETDFMSLLRLL